MEKINMDGYFVKSDFETKLRLCNSPKEIDETEKINQHMKKVQQEVRSRFALSAMKARRFIFTR